MSKYKVTHRDEYGRVKYVEYTDQRPGGTAANPLFVAGLLIIIFVCIFS